MPDAPTRLVDMSVGDWIRPRLDPRMGTVGGVVPCGFPAYARVLHPIDPTGSRVRWAQVCAATGATGHALMQWHRICAGWPTADRPNPLESPGSHTDPEVGSLDPDSLTA